MKISDHEISVDFSGKESNSNEQKSKPNFVYPD